MRLSLRSLFSFFSNDLAIDLGTANTLIIHNDKVVVDEPSIVAKEVRTDKVIAIGKRARQLSAVQKEELSEKLAEFASDIDNLEEIFENKEQIEISRYFERLPKSSTVAAEELINDELFFRDPEDKDDSISNE